MRSAASSSAARSSGATVATAASISASEKASVSGVSRSRSQPLGQLDHRRVAARRDVGEDRRDRRVDVGVGLALLREQRREARLEVGVGRGEELRHRASLSRSPAGPQAHGVGSQRLRQFDLAAPARVDQQDGDTAADDQADASQGEGVRHLTQTSRPARTAQSAKL